MFCVHVARKVKSWVCGTFETAWFEGTNISRGQLPGRKITLEQSAILCAFLGDSLSEA